ncbi:glucose/quinate/shikimate family membrane-bound PQQ-dependent dehydrogenase [Pseudomonas simiae]|jgi:quinoprotein glucose dehydrogenase|uniref:Membrane-bound PQQ-dependent dehydrogenase, glucose/quinate/shikimate family n=1 Tax=Pseudomonas simiae TaxID=321846 RepID=A0ABS9GA87_9PSED|nr:glucose/quinate/shikimate family membrane-bound PQQ-dependent dehydrogenase [Pseudomonas simiae]MBD8739402.1 glucose/quinate/shikimate family membrane-bound PQQ-dependent dehydrogenase [Pseudomonas fluorescens]PHX41997.1 glucose dehydrogenase [Pseudomonas sp. NZIPFR-PS2]AJP50745.1 quinoprotein glucose dehydrogenase [Pseudomonas simiae]AJZ92580.1 glucose dehydrogenase [Pseudomonas simiae]MBC3965500.1 glucose/quinate/shikimate family membrane-bound PQQ-dependent dehydrogenase [Pseudomonas sim
MSTDGASSPSRLLPRLLGVLLLIMGLALLAGGIKLTMLGGSLYYLLAGIGITLTGVLLLATRRAALGLYALVLFASTVWALWEVGLDWWQLVPRLALLFALGIVMLLPWFRRPLLRGQPAPLGTGALSVAVVLAGATALASQFTNPGEMVKTGQLDRDAVPGMASAAPSQAEGDWNSYGRSAYGDRYSPLAQITPENAHKLVPAWTYRTGDIPGPNDPGETTAENTPLKVNGMLYVCTPHSQVIALDPDTGKEIWRFDPKISSMGAENFKGWAHMTCRGVSYHDDAAYASEQSPTGSASPAAAPNACPKRIFVPTADTRLIALNADTGKMCEDFGDKGQVDLRANIGGFAPGGYYSTSPPAVTKNLVVIGGHVTDNVSTDEPSGVIRAFDVHTGKLVWNWDSGNPDDTTPLAEGKTYTRNSPNMWSMFAVDEKLGMLYLPMGNQMPDQYGGDRTDDSEKYAAGLTALDIDTGHVKWTFQFTHHDLWDMDVGGQPSLIDIKTEAGVKQAVMASTKQGSIYVLDRATGQPVVPIHEVAVPQGAVAGDRTSPTQPKSDLNFMPPPLKERDMWGVTPFDQLLCRIDFKSMRYDGAFTPPSLQGSIVYPGNFGVFDWGGISVDPVRQIAFVNPSYMAFKSKLIPAADIAKQGPRVSETEGVQPNKGAPYGVILEAMLSPMGLPCQAPAWGYVAAVDLTTHKTIWMHKNGTVRDSAPVPIPLTMGVPSLGGTFTTAGGVAFLSGTLDQYLRAYDVKNGKQLWEGRLPAGAQTTPMTYTGKDGKQYVLVMAGGHGSLGTKQGDYVMAFKLPE